MPSIVIFSIPFYTRQISLSVVRFTTLSRKKKPAIQASSRSSTTKMAILRTLTATAVVLASTVLAKTDIGDCTYIDGVYTPAHGYPYATRTWYLPDTGEICEILDCGGGRAPPKTTVPGCDAYEGTATYSPSFLDLESLGLATATASSESDSDEATTTAESKTIATATAPDVTSTSVSGEQTGPATTAAPSMSSASQSGSSSSNTASEEDSSDEATQTESGSSTEPTGAAAAPTAAVLGGYLMAGAAILGML